MEKKGTRTGKRAVSDETKRYKITDEDMKKAQVNKNKKSSKKSKNDKKSKAWNIIKKVLIALLILGILAGLIGAGIVAGIFLGFFGEDFKMTKDDLVIAFSNSEVYDSEGNLLCTLNGTEKRKIVSLDQMPEYLPKAYVAIEDERFYEHSGVDIKRTGAATLTYLLHRGNSSFGGSSITQQLVKNITKEDEDSALRKVKEMARAIQIEKEISKDNILELYLNVIFVGGDNINGVALGAEYYFNKDVSQLDLAECAFLAGINHTPNSYNPYNGTEERKAKNIENGKSRTKTVLKKMLELGFVTNKEEYDVAVAKVDNGFAFAQGISTNGVIYSAHTEAAIKQIVDQLMDEKGMTREMAETVVYGGGYKIYTTQVTSIQKTMEEEMAKNKYIIPGNKKIDGVLLNEQSQAAMVVIDHTTGNVVGCVGKLGAKTTNGDLNRATQSPRQIGSAMKPISVIAPAVQEGVINPSSVYVDKQTSEFTGKPWPKNYYKGFKGAQTVRQAIAISGNVIPVTILRDTGLSKSIGYLAKMGLNVDESVGLSLALGAKEFTPLQMAAAYATIANDGTYIEPTFYSKIVDSAGNTIAEPHQKREEVFGKSECYIIKSIITEPVLGAGQQHIVECLILMFVLKLVHLMMILIDGFVDLHHIIQVHVGMDMIEMKMLYIMVHQVILLEEFGLV
jgi:penicillin-binding protein 1A